MKTKILLMIVAVAVSISPSCIQAAAVPWVGVLGTGSGGAITVPAGKILVINMFGTPGTGSYSMTITGTATGGIGSGNFSAPLLFVSTGAGLVVPPSPIRLGPGMTLTNNSNASFTVHGIALDTTDFFASASPASQGLSLAGGQLATIIDSRTTVPTQTIGESSTDLQTWTTTGVTVSQSSSNPRISRVTTAADTPSKFLRARLATRTVSSGSQ